MTQSSNSSSNRPVRRAWPRSDRACTFCKMRKVRCIILGKEPPCVNCLKDGNECVLPEGRRRKPHLTYFRVGETKVDSPESNSPKDLPRYDVNERDRQSSIEHSVNASYKDKQVSCETVQPQHSENWLPEDLPFQGIPGHITISHIQELVRNQIFDLPSSKLLMQLVASYLRWHHPLNPVLDSNDLLNLVDSKRTKVNPPSLLLLYSVIFVGADSLDLHHLQLGGYRTREQARSTFFRRALTLINCKYETEPYRLLQASLLLTKCEDQDGARPHMLSLMDKINKHPWYRRGRTANADSSDIQGSSKRLWWLCFARDQEIALANHRNPACTIDQIQIPMLDIGDFSYIHTDSNQYEFLRNWCPQLLDTNIQRLGATLCIERVRMLSLIWSNSKPGKNDSVASSIMNYPVSPASTVSQGTDNSHAESNCGRSAIERLTSWHNTLPKTARISFSRDQSGNQEDDANFYRSQLEICYSLQLLRLAQKTISSPDPSSFASSTHPSTISQTAVIDTCRVLYTLCQNGSMIRLSSPMIVQLLPLFAVAVPQTDKEFRSAHYAGFTFCLHTITSLSCMNTVSDLHRNMLQSLVEMMYHRLPVESKPLIQKQPIPSPLSTPPYTTNPLNTIQKPPTLVAPTSPPLQSYIADETSSPAGIRIPFFNIDEEPEDLDIDMDSYFSMEPMPESYAETPETSYTSIDSSGEVEPDSLLYRADEPKSPAKDADNDEEVQLERVLDFILNDDVCA